VPTGPRELCWVKVLTVDDQFDVPLLDPVLLAEVELTTSLIIAASQCDRHLTQDEIDALLGLPPRGNIPPQVRRSPTEPVRPEPTVRGSIPLS